MVVAKRYKQKSDFDYFEVFAPIARLDIVCMIISLVAQIFWKIYQIDVKSAFLNCVFKEEVYVEQIPNYEKKGEEDKIYRLKKDLCGLKQAPRDCIHVLTLIFLIIIFKSVCTSILCVSK